MIIINQNQYQFAVFLLLGIAVFNVNGNNCGFGHFADNEGSCIECLSACSECKDLTNQCSSCSEGQFLSKEPPGCLNCPLGQLVCNVPIIECSPHYVLIDKKCEPVCLVNNCRTCANIYTNSCLVCEEGYLLNSESNLCTLNNRNLQVENFGVNIEPNMINEERNEGLNSELPQSVNAVPIENFENQSNENSSFTLVNPQLNNQSPNQSNSIELNENVNSSNNQNEQGINSIEPSLPTSSMLAPNSSQGQGFSSFPNINSEFESFSNTGLSFNNGSLINTNNQPINQNISSDEFTNESINELQSTDLPTIEPNDIPFIQPTDIPPLDTISLEPNQSLLGTGNEADLIINSEGSVDNRSNNGNSSVIDSFEPQSNGTEQNNTTDNRKDNNNENISARNNSELSMKNEIENLPETSENIEIALNNESHAISNEGNHSNLQNIETNSTSIQEEEKNITDPAPLVETKTLINEREGEVNITGGFSQIPLNSNSNTDTLENKNGTIINGSENNLSSECGIGFYFDLVRNLCLPCYSKCLTCYKNADQCLECAEGWQKEGWKCVTNELLYYNLTLTPNRTENRVESYISEFKNSFLTTLLPQTYQNQNSSILTLSSANYDPQTNALTLKGLINNLPSLNIANVENSVNEKFRSLEKIGSFAINNFSLSSSRVNAGEKSNENEGRNRNSNSNLASILVPSIIGSFIVLAFFSILLCYCCKICCFKEVSDETKAHNASPVVGTERHFVEKYEANGAPYQENYEPQVSGAQPSSSLSKHSSALSDKITVIEFEMVPQKKESVVKNMYESNLEDEIINQIKN